MNLGRKKKPFQEEMERMRDFQFSFLILEFDMADVLKYPEGSKVPKAARSKVRVTGKYLPKCLMEFQIWYDTKILFCGDKGNAFLVTNIYSNVSPNYSKAQTMKKQSDNWNLMFIATDWTLTTE